MHWNVLLTAGLLVAGASVATAQDMPPVPEPPSAPEAPTAPTVTSLMKEFSAAERAWRTDYAAARKAGRQATTPRPAAGEWAPRMLEAARATQSSGEALVALGWIVQRMRSGEERAAALALAREKYLEHPGLAGLASGLSRASTTDGSDFLRALMTATPHQELRGQACFYLASALRRQASMARYLQQPGKERTIESYSRTYGAAQVAGWLKADPAALEQEAAGHFEQCVQKFADVAYGRSTLGQVAAGELNELRNLIIGKTAPEIVGTDFDGAELKLSDYRGKVVVIDFWGDW